MPIYVYECKKCEHQFEEFQKFEDDSLQSCPKCDGEVFRVIQPTPVFYQAYGFKTTDDDRFKQRNLEEAKRMKGWEPE